MLFALRSVAHKSAGFSPAELVYGRALRSPLRLLRENWEGQDDDPTVVEYVCNLLQRMYETQLLVEANMLEAQMQNNPMTKTVVFAVSVRDRKC